MVSSAYDNAWITETSEAICNVLDDAAKRFAGRGTNDNDAWTREILAQLARLGKSQERDNQGRGIWVYASKTGKPSGEASPVADGGEWLFDLCWLLYESKERGAQLLVVPLVMEMEWGNLGDVIDDFEKLILARARLRVMVFSDTTRARVNSLLGKLSDLARGFEDSNSSDRYLLCGYSAESKEFIYKLIG